MRSFHGKPASTCAQTCYIDSRPWRTGLAWEQATGTESGTEVGKRLLQTGFGTGVGIMDLKLESNFALPWEQGLREKLRLATEQCALSKKSKERTVG